MILKYFLNLPFYLIASRLYKRDKHSRVIKLLFRHAESCILPIRSLDILLHSLRVLGYHNSCVRICARNLSNLKNSYSLYWHLAHSLFAIGDFDGAKKSYHQFTNYKPSSDSYLPAFAVDSVYRIFSDSFSPSPNNIQQFFNDSGLLGFNLLKYYSPITHLPNPLAAPKALYISDTAGLSTPLQRFLMQ